MNENFNVGDELRDRGTNGRVKITAINSPHPRTGNPRKGFTWVNLGGTQPGDKDHEGFCPASCAGAFEVIPPPTTWAERNCPTFRGWWARLVATAVAGEPTNQDVIDALREEYGTVKFSQGWQAQDWPPADEDLRKSERILAELALKYPAKISPVPVPTLEQQLAAMIAGGTMWRKDWSPGMMIDETELASDALAVAREIISQSEIK